METFSGDAQAEQAEEWLRGVYARGDAAWMLLDDVDRAITGEIIVGRGHVVHSRFVAAIGALEGFRTEAVPDPYAVYHTPNGVVAVWRLDAPIPFGAADVLANSYAARCRARPHPHYIPLPGDMTLATVGGSFIRMPWRGGAPTPLVERASNRLPALAYGGGVTIDGTARHVEDPRTRRLEAVLSGLGFRGSVVSVRPGPTITLFAVQLEAGTQESKIIARERDVAREMGALSVRVAAIPGTTTIGIEIPNSQRETVRLTELIDGAAFRSSPAKLALALGKTIGGEPVITDLARMPHLLLAGTTGSGKSVGLNVMILSLLYRMSPEQLRFIMIDPKELELAAYDGIPHLLRPIATDPGPAIAALEWAINEMGARYKRMRGKCMGIADYQRDFPDDPMPYLVIVVDEVADLMAMADKKTVEGLIQRLAQKGRAAGIHLIIATQRPSVDVITGVIKANFPSRIAFQVVTGMDSKVILDTTGAEQLLGQGDALFMDCGRTPNRVHVSYVSMSEIQQAVSVVKAKWGVSTFDEEFSAGEDAPVFDGTGMGEREPVGARRGDKIKLAMEFLEQMLSENGAMLSNLLYELASREEPSIAATTLLDASKRLKVVKTNPTEDGKFRVGTAQLWSLP